MDLRSKEVINIKDGVRLGCVDDIEIDQKNAVILALVIYGRAKFFGLFGREDDLIIEWHNIEIIGEDTILVRFDGYTRVRTSKKHGWLDQFFKG
ncbi:MAG TPA: YlmC/YmxH family sporulation protein [Firmicutes bacterium]|nr:YlmC/YmxH family sporulation protein [Bacillota bacterium]